MRERGCLYWIGMCFLAVLAIGLLGYALGIVLAVGIGVGSWLGMRYVWRSLVREAPNSMFVDIWINRPPIVRKLAMGVVSLSLAIVMMVAYYTALNEASSKSASPLIPTASHVTVAEQPIASCGNSAGS